MAAVRGNILHKVWEMLAQTKLAQQENRESFICDGIGDLDAKLPDANYFLKLSYEYYKQITPECTFKDDDFKECKKLMDKGLNAQNGSFNPLNLDIVQPEQRFDIKLEQDWAKYEWEYQGEKIQGNLVLRGTIDLISRVSDDTWEIIDLKTGAMRDWGKNKNKDYNTLMDDDQLILYYYAVKRLYPKIKHTIVTINYIKHQPITLPYGQEQYDKAEKLLKTKLKLLKKIKVPKLTIDYRCGYCHFGKTKQEGSNLSICEYMRQQIKKNGLQNTVDTHLVNIAKLKEYAGGGRST
jgi:hypothetical protein